jgi:hypothetical protein
VFLSLWIGIGENKIFVGRFRNPALCAVVPLSFPPTQNEIKMVVHEHPPVLLDEFEQNPMFRIEANRQTNEARKNTESFGNAESHNLEKSFLW